MSDDPTQDRAGLYVLGVLDTAEMAAVRRDALQDRALEDDIAAWELRLAPLAGLAGETPPPSALWDAIQARLDGALPFTGAPLPRRGSARAPASRAVAAWRTMAPVAMALVAGLALFLVWRLQSPVAPAVPALSRLAMILPLQQTPGGWLVELQPNGQLRVVAQGNVSRPSDRDFELWALAAGAKAPVPLGLLPVASASAVLAPGNLPTAKFKLLVSLEPKGGSPTGAPTGPVLFGGDVLEPAKL